MIDQQPGDLVARFPALKRLRSGQRQIPFVQQLSATECGAACLSMVLAFHGRHVRLDQVREACAADRDGVNALSLRNAARRFGLRARGVRVDVEQLALLSRGAILHWEFNHFVVFDRLTRRGVVVVDPAHGRQQVPLPRFRKAFTGVALLLEPTDDFTSSPRPRSHLGRIMRAVFRQSGLVPRIAVTSLLIQLFALALPVFTGQFVDRVAPHADRHLLMLLSVGAAAMVGFNFLATLVRSHLLLHLRTLLDSRMTLGFVDHLIGLPYSFFQLRSAGDLMMRMNSNAVVREILTSGVLSGLLDGTLVASYLVALLLISPQMGLLVACVGMADLAVLVLMRMRQRELAAENLRVEAAQSSYQVEMLTGIATIKAMGCEERALSRYANLFVDVLNVSLRRGRLNALVDAAISALRLAAPLTILVGGALLIMGGRLTLGTMLALSSLGNAVLLPLSSLVGTGMQLQLLGSYFDRLDDVLDTAPEQRQSGAQAPLPQRLSGAVELREVSFRYGPMAPLVVEDVSLKVSPGQFVALVGPSGGGKSTLAALLLGLHRPTSGRVLYDGVDLLDCDLGALRRQMGIVIQNAELFAGSIRDNIALSDPSRPMADVVAAAMTAQIHGEIAAMPLRYETPLLDRGASISGGQRQRLALARALIHCPSIVLLDEATSALDALTESRIYQALDELRCTRIVVAHRLSTIARADLIVVVDGGRIVQAGRHHELMSAPGLYQRLVSSQTELAAV